MIVRTRQFAGRPFVPWFDGARLDGLDGLVAWDSETRTLTAVGPGVLCVDGELVVILPRAFADVAETDERRWLALAANTFASLARYASRVQKSVVPAEVEAARRAVGGDLALADVVEAALLLHTDWLESGPLAMTSSLQSTKHGGRIAWGPTLRQHPPVTCVEGDVFPGLVRTRVGRDPLHPLARLHALACADAARFLGLPAHTSETVSGTEARSVLGVSAGRLFADRPRRVHALLDRFLLHSGGGQRGASESTRALFARKYDVVWEEMLREVLGSVDRIPLGGSYALKDEKSQAVAFRTDILLRRPSPAGDLLLVVDAKDYDFARGELPPAHDVEKQILYRHLLSSNHLAGAPPPERIANVFAFPGPPAASPVRLVGRHDLFGEASKPYAFGRIVCVAVDLERVARAYAQGRTDPAMATELSRIAFEQMAAST